jgi:hypothetical protein
MTDNNPAASSVSAGAGQVPADTVEKARVLADTAARAVTQPSAFCRNDFGLQQELGQAVAAMRLALAAVRTPGEQTDG